MATARVPPVTWLYVIGYSCHNNQLMTNSLDCHSCLLFQSRLSISKHFETPGKEHFTKHNSYQIFLNKLRFSWIVIYNTLLKIWMIWQLQWVEGKGTHTPDLKLHFSPKIFPKKPISTLCFKYNWYKLVIPWTGEKRLSMKFIRLLN